MIASNVGSTNLEAGSVESLSPPRRHTERAPLLSQRRLFRSLSGVTSSNSDSAPDATGRTLNTFAGVFAPVTLSMFSALVFLRVGYLVGNAGLLETLLQFVIAYAILIFTVTSICAISTNGAVEGGGAYFMISRTLGPELGGSIGTLFFFANVVSSALYVTGCTEGLIENFGPSGYLLHENEMILPDGRWWRFLYSSSINSIGLLVSVAGSGLFAKTTLVTLSIVFVCLLSVFVSFFAKLPTAVRIPVANQLLNTTYQHFGNYTGLSSATLESNLYPNYGLDYTGSGSAISFATTFGVLFSGVTGIMAGANMSGELENPGRSIPRGTLSAVTFTGVVYALLSLLTASTCTPFLLQNNYIYMMGINLWSPFITIGIITATFSASLSNLIGSSRVLEAVAKDEIFGRGLHYIIRGTTNSGNPIAAVVTAWFLVELFLLIGSLNVIAQLNSVLFLVSYLATNLACLGLELASAPNFRPSFKYFSWHTALFGLLGTVCMMFVINPVYASLSLVACFGLLLGLYLLSPTRSNNWGSISQALIFHQVRKYLLMLDSRKDHVKFWRPQMLLLVANPRASCPLIDFVNDLKKGGLYVLGHVHVDDFETINETDPTLEEYSHWLTLVDHLKVKAFVELTVARTIREGVQHLMRISGLGAMKPNTVVLGFYDEALPRDFFELEESQFRTEKFRQQEHGQPVYNLRSPDEERRLGLHEYVNIVQDILKLNKNVGLCRNFTLLNKHTVARNKNLRYIDVWPMNFLAPDDACPFDKTSLFMYQLACILNMVSNWKNLQLRVFLVGSIRPNNSALGGGIRELQLQEMLQMLRINARIEPLVWENVVALQKSENREISWNLNTLRHDYIQGVNDLVRHQSNGTAVSFIYLPAPPVDSSLTGRYFHLLTELTGSLPPTMLVHGVSPVTSTTL